MLNIIDYINPSFIDGHFHIFDIYRYDNINTLDICDKCVCFGDIIISKLDKHNNYEDLYSKWIDKCYNKNTHILLATGVNAEQAINIHRNHPTIIKGFGELKCKDKDELNLYNIECEEDLTDLLRWDELIEYNNNYKLPIYIHYTLNENNFKEFELFLTKCKNFPVILCHYGITMPEYYKDKTWKENDVFNKVNYLLSKYNNLYVDVSYGGASWIYYNKKYDFIPINKCIFGCDINPTILNNGKKDVIEEYINIYKFYMEKFGEINNKNIYKLFK